MGQGPLFGQSLPGWAKEGRRALTISAPNAGGLWGRGGGRVPAATSTSLTICNCRVAPPLCPRGLGGRAKVIRPLWNATASALGGPPKNPGGPCNTGLGQLISVQQLWRPFRSLPTQMTQPSTYAGCLGRHHGTRAPRCPPGEGPPYSFDEAPRRDHHLPVGPLAHRTRDHQNTRQSHHSKLPARHLRGR